MERTALQVAEELLVLRTKAGDEDSLRLLVHRWTPRLVRHSARLVRDVHLARDAVQEAWVAIAAGVRRLEDPSLFGPWAYRIVHHKSVDLIRRERRHAEAIERASASRAHAAHDEPASDTGAAEPLRRALRDMDPERRALLSLFYIDELTVGQLAVVLDVPSGTVKSRLFAARKELRQRLEPEAKGEIV